MREQQLRLIWEKTHGHCHFCGDPVEFQKRGWTDGELVGYWEVDHIIQRGKGGAMSPENCLPACTRCNRLRWHRTGEAIRELLLLGLVASSEVRRHSDVGNDLERLRQDWLRRNERRRLPSRPAAQA